MICAPRPAWPWAGDIAYKSAPLCTTQYGSEKVVASSTEVIGLLHSPLLRYPPHFDKYLASYKGNLTNIGVLRLAEAQALQYSPA